MPYAFHGLQIGEEKMKTDFEAKVNKLMDEMVESHQHNHPLYADTRIQNSIVDAENQMAAFVLFEQIDTDRCTPEGHGWKGDQFRYSLWVIEGDSEPNQLYEDHAYIRQSKSALTNSRGRDCSIHLNELLEDGVMVQISPEGVTEGGAYHKTKVKIKFDGTMEEPDNFAEQAENYVKRMAPTLGYDFTESPTLLESRGDVAAVKHTAENGSTYGFDVIYLVWKDKDGNLNHDELVNSKFTKDYLFVNSIGEKDGRVVVDVKGREYSRRMEDLNLKGE